MNLKKYLLLGGVVLGFGLTGCVGDLDIEPNDPNLINTKDPNFKANTIAMCYSGIACSGISGPGSTYVEGVDPGNTAYNRCILTCNEFCTDEMNWIWPNDMGGSIGDIVGCQWSANNQMIYGTYYRLLGHIALCNQFLANTADDADAETLEMRAEARMLRAYSYYNMLDLFGQSSFITEEAEVGEAPKQISRAELFSWVETELKEIVDQKLIAENPVYGRVGIDGAEALLARLYLNAEVFAGQDRWADMQQRCENIIARHQGGGFNGSGLANTYHYLFCADNTPYMPGGGNKAENEILFGIAFDSQMTQSYGGCTVLIAGTVMNNDITPPHYYGTNGDGSWGCIKAVSQMAERFYGSGNDVRDNLWIRGTQTAPNGDTFDFNDEFVGFTGDWATVGGNDPIKFTNATKNPAGPGNYDANLPLSIFDGVYGFDAQGNQNFQPRYAQSKFPSTDFPIIRLADIYLMYTEGYVVGHKGDATKALKYINYVRGRAQASTYNAITEVTKKVLMDERSRELYLEGTRRTDLVRAGYFVGPSQTVWQCKGSLDNTQGTRIGDKYALYPIPMEVLMAQPDFKQNPGY